MKKEEENSSCIKFNPPMSIQRYKEVVGVLSQPEFKSEIKKVVDFGCSELLFFRHLKRVPHVTEISAVDIDFGTLDVNKYRAAPLATDFLYRRAEPLSVCVYNGSIAVNDDRLRCYDAVICIELIEHLHADVLDKVPDAVFGFIRPKVAIVTTPNADFNVLFPTLQVFRHWDHKFEWSRQEFSDWCSAVVSKYPSYTFTTRGIGQGPSGTENLGHCSQMAVFRLLNPEYRDGYQEIATPNEPYTLVDSYKHPHRAVTKPTPELILADLQYYLRLLARRDEWTEDTVEVSLKDLLTIPKIEKLHCSLDSARQILTSAGWTIISRDGDHFIQYQVEESCSDGEDDEINTL